jgi:hypothetical protein
VDKPKATENGSWQMNWQRVRFNIPLAVLLGFELCSCSQPTTQSQLPVSMDRSTTRYDRFKDETTVMSAAAEITNRLLLWFVYECKGDSTEFDTRSVFATFRANSPSPYARFHDVIFLADGLRIRPQFDVPPSASLGNRSDLIVAMFDLDDFLKLIHSHSVEGELGTTEFTVKESDLEKWRTFAAGIRSSKNPEQKRKR